MFKEPYAKLLRQKSYREALLEELKKLDREVISAGIHKSDGAKVVGSDGVKLIDIAVQNHYGNEWIMPRTVRFQKNGKWFAIKKDTHIKIPATRFVSRLIENQQERVRLLEEVQANLHIQFSNANRFGEIKISDTVKNIGQYMKNRIKSYIDDRVFETNAPMTVEAKGFDQRLKDKGLLYESIDWRSKKQRKHS
ncbi:TPA: hypothetical protein CPT85_04520 [Candidatus Gastranaerophilales bacterium HUM_21]|nr:MAG TPA: hypothetical protein CPT85_04520 [Candidatus Gastranaerophilales bacterium HUM_21]